ncbi:hypothetical protein OHA25_06045 [Nonomuraea sp. NBC_00507]|uniref:hypothetical protein n=1 Tax=Nonomuraea sp. NBC_00507 TaxID=2976002 RepID=UPI002E195172
MPSCVPREDARYFGGALPTLVLYSAEPIVQLPTFRLVSGRPSTCVGWEFIPGVTFSMVEGPGRFRLMVEGITHRDEADERFAWLCAVDRAGGAVVAAVDGHNETFSWAALAESGRARGGYMPVIRRSG